MKPARTGPNPQAQERYDAGADTKLKEIVLGLHWTPPEEFDAGTRSEEPADLDAFCVLQDEKGCVLEVIHPGHPRNGNGSVVHTGDSRTGASTWDDERIFVFLAALPPAVAAITFAVASVDDRAFGEVRGAFCHVSDAATEREVLQIELTSLGGQTAHCVATLHRRPSGWEIASGAPAFDGITLRALIAANKDGK
jgi:stress response protein SCP2